jgi:hypothetical protein
MKVGETCCCHPLRGQRICKQPSLDDSTLGSYAALAAAGTTTTGAATGAGTGAGKGAGKGAGTGGTDLVEPFDPFGGGYDDDGYDGEYGSQTYRGQYQVQYGGGQEGGGYQEGGYQEDEGYQDYQ